MHDSQLIIEGLGYGLILTILVGPIVVALTQTGMEKGIRAGLIVGAGVWISDIIIVYLLYFLMKSISIDLIEGQFKLYLGLIGGLVLIGFGIGSYIKKINFLENTRSFSARSLLGYFMKGFIVNTVNPFTFVFWATLISGYVVINELSASQAMLFFGSIIGTIMLTDSLKVILAKRLSTYINQRHIGRISKVAGLALIIFGFILIIRVLL